MGKKQLLCALTCLLILSGCALPTYEVNPTETVEEAPAVSSTEPIPQEAAPTQPPAPTATFAPTATLTPTPYAPFTATSWVDHLNVRANPGKLFAVVMTVMQGTSFTVLGQAPGGDWIQVKSETNTTGWIYSQFLKTDQNLKLIPVITPEDVLVVTGGVFDPSGNPISGIQFSITQGVGVAEQRTDATTDASGKFYAFLPTTVQGEWAVAYTAVACTSNTMDENCDCKEGKCGSPNPVSTTIILPKPADLIFTWN